MAWLQIFILVLAQAVYAAQDASCERLLAPLSDFFALGNRPQIMTERLILRPYDPSIDRKEDVARLMNDVQVKREWETAGLWHSGLVDQLTVDWSLGARRWSESQPDVTRLDFVIVDKRDGSLIGALHTGLHARVKKIELGYEVASRVRNQGYTTEALRGFIDFLEGRCGPSYLYAWVYEENIASQRVLEKLGFRDGGSYANGDRTQKFLFRPKSAILIP